MSPMGGIAAKTGSAQEAFAAPGPVNAPGWPLKKPDGAGTTGADEAIAAAIVKVATAEARDSSDAFLEIFRDEFSVLTGREMCTA